MKKDWKQLQRELEELESTMTDEQLDKVEYVCLNCHQSLDNCECAEQEPEVIN